MIMDALIEARRQVEDLERLLDGVRQDRAEAIAEGWPGAREKYDDLEMKVREQLAAAKAIVKRREGFLGDPMAGKR